MEEADVDDLIKYTIIYQTKTSELFELLIQDSDLTQSDILNETGLSTENIDAINEMEKTTSEQLRGKSVFQLTRKPGFKTFCQNELQIKKKVELLQMFKQGKINSYEDLKNAKNEIGYQEELQLRIVHDDNNLTFKDKFNEFYQKVQDGQFPIEQLRVKPKDILVFEELIDLLLYSILNKNKIGPSIVQKLRYATYIKNTDDLFQENIRNFIETNCQIGLKLAKKYTKLLKANIPQTYERIQVQSQKYAIEGFNEIDNLEQENIDITESPYFKSFQNEFKSNYQAKKFLNQKFSEKEFAKIQEFVKNPKISIKEFPEYIQEYYDDKEDYEIETYEESENYQKEIDMINENSKQNKTNLIKGRISPQKAMTFINDSHQQQYNQQGDFLDEDYQEQSQNNKRNIKNQQQFRNRRKNYNNDSYNQEQNENKNKIIEDDDLFD